MRILIVRIVFMFVATTDFAGAGEPSAGTANNSEAPVLEYFELIPTTPNTSNSKMPSFKIGKLLLTIRSIRSVTIQADGKGVIVVLNDADRKKFAELTRKFQGGVLFCQVSQNPLVGGIGFISAPTENGVIEFSEARSSGNIAEYLRHRFWE